MSYLLHILILINIYSILAIALNLLSGYTGLLSICQAAFWGVGAYVTALLTLNLGIAWLPSLLIGMILSGILAIGVGIVSLRFRNDYFIIATFAFQILAYNIMLNWIDLTQGPLGLPGIPQPKVFGWTISSHFNFYVLSMIFLILTFITIRRIVTAPFGRVLRAIREDEKYTEGQGKNVTSFKVLAFVVGAMFSALAGSIYASYIKYIDPSSFTVMESIFILAIVIIGGSGNIWGSILGASVLISIPELLRLVGLPASVSANIRQILYGLFLVILMIWRPQGFVGHILFKRTNV